MNQKYYNKNHIHNMFCHKTYNILAPLDIYKFIAFNNNIINFISTDIFKYQNYRNSSSGNGSLVIFTYFLYFIKYIDFYNIINLNLNFGRTKK